MRSFQPDRFAAVTLIVVILTLSAEGWSLQRAMARTERAKAELRQRQDEQDTLRRRSPAPTEENERQVALELAESRSRLAAARIALAGAEAGDVPAPKTSVEAFFEIAAFVATIKAAAVRAGVGLRPDESFGFGAYASEGPAPEILPAIWRQRTALGRLLEALVAAQPTALISVQRERPLPGGATIPKVDAGPAAVGDFFTPAPGLFLKTSGKIDSDGFQLRFDGPTRVLRDFLNALVEAPGLLVVRSVAVDHPPESKAGHVPGGNPADAPVVVPTLSRYTVVVEAVRLTDLEKTSL